MPLQNASSLIGAGSFVFSVTSADPPSKPHPQITALGVPCEVLKLPAWTPSGLRSWDFAYWLDCLVSRAGARLCLDGPERGILRGDSSRCCASDSLMVAAVTWGALLTQAETICRGSPMVRIETRPGLSGRVWSVIWHHPDMASLPVNAARRGTSRRRRVWKWRDEQTTSFSLPEATWGTTADPIWGFSKRQLNVRHRLIEPRGAPLAGCALNL